MSTRERVVLHLYMRVLFCEKSVSLVCVKEKSHFFTSFPSLGSKVGSIDL